MTTPPPPPPESPDWPSSATPPSSQPSQSSQPWPPSSPASGGGRQKWWTGGRVVAAIAIVLVLMGVSAVGGFVAGSTWGTIDSFAGEFDLDEEGFPFGGDVPGFVSPDSPAAPGETLRPGSEVSDTVAGQPVEHPLTVESSRTVALEITSAEFDTVLVVLDSTGEVVDANDDGGNSTNSALSLSLSPGDYRVRVQPWGEGDGGSYTLAVD